MRWEGESRMGIVAHSKWMESWGGEVGVKRRERDLAGFEALVVCDGEVFCFFPLLQRDNDWARRGCVCSRYSHLFFLFFVIHLCLNMPTTPCHFLSHSVFVAVKQVTSWGDKSYQWVIIILFYVCLFICWYFGRRGYKMGKMSTTWTNSTYEKLKSLFHLWKLLNPPPQKRRSWSIQHVTR